MVTVYIGIGSNLSDPMRQLRLAAAALRQLPQSRYLGDSGVYRSRALPLPEARPGEAAQPDYRNAVAAIETGLDAHDLLERLQAIELRQGRVRDEHWGPRTLDLDILLYGGEQIDDSRLRVPHPEMCRRDFVLVPLQRLAPGLEIPGHGKLADMIERCPSNGLQYLGSIDNPGESGGDEREP